MATYYIRFDTYWQNSPNRFVGPFSTRQAAEDAIKAAENATNSKVARSSQMANDLRNGIRVFGVLSSTEAKRYGLRHNYEALDELPRNTTELAQMRAVEQYE